MAHFSPTTGGGVAISTPGPLLAHGGPAYLLSGPQAASCKLIRATCFEFKFIEVAVFFIDQIEMFK